jgi:DNA polymerase-3 subunit delta
MGDEPYYIDIVSDYIEKNVLSEEEKGFNQTVLYGRDVSVEDIIYSQTLSNDGGTSGGDCKEAQDLSRTIDKLESYAETNAFYRFGDLLQIH